MVDALFGARWVSQEHLKVAAMVLLSSSLVFWRTNVRNAAQQRSGK